jgi:hypothetical protein
LDPAETYVGYEFWTGEFLPPFSGKLEMEVPLLDCRITALRPLSDHPQVLGTSRHITQGTVDLLDESWDSERRVLSGKSRLVEQDSYEIRIATGTPENPLTCKAVKISDADQDAGVTAEVVEQDGWKLRVRLLAPVSGTVAWSVQF